MDGDAEEDARNPVSPCAAEFNAINVRQNVHANRCDADLVDDLPSVNVFGVTPSGLSGAQNLASA